MIKEVVLSNDAQESIQVTRSGFDETCQALADYLSRVKVRYVLVNRLYEGREIEIIIAPNVLRHIKAYIVEFCKLWSLIPIQKVWQRTTSCLFILADYDHVSGTTAFYRFRFSSSFEVQGYQYFSSEELLENKSYVCNSQTWRLNDSYSFVTSIMQCIAAKQVDRGVFLELSALWKCVRSSVQIILERFLDRKGRDWVFRSFEEEDFQYFSDHLYPLQAHCHFSIVRHWSDVLARKINVMRNAFRPPGLVIGVLGRDGVGKSAFVTELTRCFECVFEEVASFKRHPKVFYKSHIFKKSADYHFTKPHLYSERGLFASFLKVSLLFSEFIIGYWLKVFPFKRRASLILYDRYFIDLLADPLRYRIKGNKWLIRTMHRLLPKPDLWIVLDLPTNILLQRKQELTFDMSEKLRKEYLRLPQLLSNCEVIENEGMLSGTVQKATTLIISYMNGRFLKK